MSAATPVSSHPREEVSREVFNGKKRGMARDSCRTGINCKSETPLKPSRKRIDQ